MFFPHEISKFPGPRRLWLVSAGAKMAPDVMAAQAQREIFDSLCFLSGLVMK